ncbi:MAG: hypothetical protein AAGH64_09655, partial [Planctomycetota bacterium]
MKDADVMIAMGGVALVKGRMRLLMPAFTHAHSELNDIARATLDFAPRRLKRVEVIIRLGSEDLGDVEVGWIHWRRRTLPIAFQIDVGQLFMKSEND